MTGRALRLIRSYKDETLSDLARSMGISISYLSEIECEKRELNLKTLYRYSDHYKIKASAILKFAEALDETECGKISAFKFFIEICEPEQAQL